jgi:hypothetical protein
MAKQTTSTEPARRVAGDFELRQMIGYTRDPKTHEKRPRKTGQDEVLRNGQRIGYVARHTSAPFTPIVRLTFDEQADATRAIDAIRAAEGLVGPTGRQVAYPAGATPEVIDSVVRRQRAAARGDDPDETNEDDDGLIDESDGSDADDELDFGE